MLSRKARSRPAVGGLRRRVCANDDNGDTPANAFTTDVIDFELRPGFSAGER